MAKFYIWDTRQIVGNACLWWRPNGQGYTTDIDDAGLYEESEARTGRETDVPVPMEMAQEIARRCVDASTLREHLVVEGLLPKPKKQARPPERGGR